MVLTHLKTCNSQKQVQRLVQVDPQFLLGYGSGKNIYHMKIKILTTAWQFVEHVEHSNTTYKEFIIVYMLQCNSNNQTAIKVVCMQTELPLDDLGCSYSFLSLLRALINHTQE